MPIFQKTFRGGVHPADGKEYARNVPYSTYLPKGDLVFPLNQHIGKPARPLVQKGDTVLAGQIIAEADGFVSANIASSCSGKVKGVENRRTVAGTAAPCIVIENDGAYTMAEGVGNETDEASLTGREILDRVKAAGIIGLGGAGFPTHVKLGPKDPSKIDYVIVNGAECEPYLTSDYRLMLEEPEKIIGGLKVILKLFDNAKGVIGIENNKPEAIAKLTELAKGEPNIEVCPLKTKYPQGGERTLIYAVTGRKVNSSMLPADMGCIVDNVDTIVAIYHAVTEGKPLMYRIVTVTGDAINDPRNFIVRIGTMYDELIEEAGGFKEEPAKVVSGGPMMGFGMFDLHVPTTKTASALLCLTKDDVSEMEPTACIKCGRCVEVCPQRLVPNKLMVASIHGDSETFLRLNGLECVECGCCSYTCPAKRPLTQSIKSMRKMEFAKKKK